MNWRTVGTTSGLLALTTILGGVAAIPAAAQPIFIELPDGFIPNGIDASGQVVSGTSGGNAYWTQSDGVVALGGTGSDLVRVSADGTSFSGGTTTPGGLASAGLWLGGTSWLALGSFPGVTSGCPGLSSSYDLSGDGSVVVGLGWDGCSARAFRWEESSGVVDLGTLVPGRPSRANAISDDANVIVGWNDLASGQRVAAKWVNLHEEFILTDGGSHVGEAQATNHDGSAIVGGNCGSSAWIWRESTDSVECIGISGANDTFFAVNDDGSVIVGTHDDNPNLREGLLYIDGQPNLLGSWLAAEGATGAYAGWINTGTALAVSADGNVLAGWGLDNAPWPIGNRGWVVVLELGAPALLLDQGIDGTELSWSRVTGSGRQDVVRGSLGVLIASGGDYSQATQDCLLNSGSATTVTDGDPDPGPGEGVWYLVRAEAGAVKGTYDSNGPAQAGSRDDEIAVSLGACP